MNIVSSLTVPYCFSLFYIDHKILFCVRIIALFKYSLPYSQMSCLYYGLYIIKLSYLHCPSIFLINEHKGKIYRTNVTSHRMSSLYSLYTCLFFDRYTMTYGRPLLVLTYVFFIYTATVSELRLKNTKVNIIALFIFKIAVVNIVSSLALPYCCFNIWYYHKFIISVRIITLFQ